MVSFVRGRRRGGTYLGFTATLANDEILAQHVDEPPIHRWSNVIKLGDERMLEPVDDAFAEEDDDRWAEDGLEEGESGHGGEDEGEGEGGGEEGEEGGSGGGGEFDEVAEGDDEEH